LELLLNAGLMQTEEALSKSSSWIDDLWETTQEPSNAAALASELHGLLLIAKEHSLLSQYSLERVQEVLMDTVSSGLRINQSLVIPQLTLKDIVISEQLLCRNLVRGEFSHFHFCNWFSLLEHSPSLTSCEFEGAKLPKSIKVGAMGDSALAAMQIVFDLKSLRYLLTELPASLHPRAVDRYREVFASLEKCETVPRQALDPIVPAAGMPKVSGTNTLLSPELGRLSIGLLEANQRYSATQFDLAQRNRELGEAKAEIDVLHHELENTRRDLSEISENLEDLGDSAEANRQIAVLQNQLAHRDEILQSIVKSPGFRLGHAVTSVAKKVPGLNKVASALKK
jgi:hypothetical protein